MAESDNGGDSADATFTAQQQAHNAHHVVGSMNHSGSRLAAQIQDPVQATAGGRDEGERRAEATSDDPGEEVPELTMLLARDRCPLLPRFRSLPARAPSNTVSDANVAPGTSTTSSAVASTPWPGPDFKVSQVLPGSVYLWACNERGEGGGTSPVSRAEACAAWVVLTVSAEFLHL
ncbi:unnamed protein product [Pylaiella littoralis]